MEKEKTNKTAAFVLILIAITVVIVALVLVISTRNEREAAALYNAVWDKAIRAAIANGGVINEHHGVGLKLGRYVKDLYGTAMPVLEGIKKHLDPNGIMNPGKLGFAGC